VYNFSRKRIKDFMKKVNETKAKATSKKAPRAKRKTTKNISQTHGKVESKTRDYVPTTLDQIWGDTGKGKYKTMDIKEYEAEIRRMAKVDLHTHASRVGIVPVDNREVLSSRLIREFKKQVASYQFPSSKTVGITNSKSDLSQKAISVLEEGR